MISHTKLRKIFADFWKSKGHVEVPGIPLVPQNDPTTLFTGSGMQQLVPNLLGEPHPLGTRLYNIQRCVRAQDIDEVGDNRHDTFFEMMGNWSLGDYFKKDQLRWVFDLYTNKEYGFGLDPSKLYVTVFGGGDGIPKDEESIELWKTLFAEKGISTDIGTAATFQPNQHITLYGADKNWWSRCGTPNQMPKGEVGGPDSEIFYDFGEERNLHETAMVKDEKCNVNCDCGRFGEIGNSVFVQYVKQADGSLKELPKKNVDFGGGLERVLAAVNNDPDVFKTDVFYPIVQELSPTSQDIFGGQSDYSNLDQNTTRSIRIIADHIRTAVQLASDGIVPGPKEQGYVMRSLIRRALNEFTKLNLPDERLKRSVKIATDTITATHQPIDNQAISESIMSEFEKYRETIQNGKQSVSRWLESRAKTREGVTIRGEEIFNLYQSTGLPPDLIVSIGQSMGRTMQLVGFEEAKQKHSELSRSGSEQKFKGGLADQSEQVVKYHTATHLLHQALCGVLGDSVRQEGSNITGERLRFDFHCDHKPTPEDITKVSSIIQSKIQEALPVNFVIVPKAEAEKLGAKSFFKEKYPDTVKVYVIGATQEEIQKVVDNPVDCRLSTAYSLEFCGGPHVTNTKEIGTIELYKTEKIGKDLYRIYGK